MIVLGSKEHGDAIAAAVDTDTYCFVISREDAAGKLLGGVIFSDYNGASVHIHAAGFSPAWMNRSLLWALFDYTFRHLCCKTAVVLISSDNQKSIALTTKVGFNKEACIKCYYRDSDLGIYTMPIENCRWLGPQPRNFCFRKA